MHKFTEKPPSYVFGADLIDAKALEQFQQCLMHTFVVRGAAMPDMHLGYTMPIGGVIATCGYVVPSWVGYDIGCGVCAIRTTFPKSLIEDKCGEIYTRILQNIPVGFNHHKHGMHWDGYAEEDPTPWFKTMFNDANGSRQLGTLGGGNHFIEIDYDVQNRIWIVIHSGSRGIGHKTATHYMKMAHPEHKAKEGTYALEADGRQGRDYIDDMFTCQRFALDNRREIGRLVMYAIQQCGIPGIPASDIKHTGFDFINRNHNHAEVNSEGLWVHRKGATHAEKNMLGVIPGDMLAGSFITLGTGNADSLCSSSHGAGRVLGRKQAKRFLDANEFETQMADITCKAGEGNLDEAPGAYKDIKKVMNAQAENCTFSAHLKPIINVKG